MAKTEYTDEFFINLTMDFDKRDDTIYPEWAKWCSLSEDRYFIDGENGHFYTHERTDEEIAIERKTREINDYLFYIENSDNPEEDWPEYVEWVKKLVEENKDHILNIYIPTYEEWKNAKKESAE